MKTNGRPKKNAERDQLIIADYKAGMSSKDLAKKYDLTTGYAQKIASEWARKERIKAVSQHKQKCGLYAERDNKLMKDISRIKGITRTIKHHDHQSLKEQRI